MVYGMINPSHILYILYIVLRSLSHSITIQVLLSLNHCAITDRHGPSYFCQKTVEQQRVMHLQLRVLSGLWEGQPLSHIVHASNNTPKSCEVV